MPKFFAFVLQYRYTNDVNPSPTPPLFHSPTPPYVADTDVAQPTELADFRNGQVKQKQSNL